MYKFLIAFILVLFSSSLFAEEITFRGPWRTTNPRKLDGQMTAVVTSKGPQKWSGRFFGIWQGVNYDYTVDFVGPPNNLIGKANIDGASYDWTGSVSQKHFSGTFTGSRYAGDFNMKAN